MESSRSLPPLDPVRPLGPVALVLEAADLLDAHAAEALANPGHFGPVALAKAEGLWPQTAADLRRLVDLFRTQEAELVAGFGFQ